MAFEAEAAIAGVKAPAVGVGALEIDEVNLEFLAASQAPGVVLHLTIFK